MKIRESGMPDEEMWSKFFNVEMIFEKLEINDSLNVIVDLGAGYGTFSFPAAKIVNKKVIAFEFEDKMVRNLREKSKNQNIKNIEIINKDFIDQGTGLQDNSIDYVMLFNILHHKEPEYLLFEALRILKPGGKVGIIHWNYDPNTPRGPPMDIRPRPEAILSLTRMTGFQETNLVNLPPYHYGIVAQK